MIPSTAAHQASLSFTISWSLFKLMSIESVMPSNHLILCHTLGTSLVAQMVKRLPAIRETQVRSLGWEDLLEKEMATHSSIPAWRIPGTEEPGRLQSMGSQSQTRLSSFTSLHFTSPPAFIFPSIRVFSSESALHNRWPKYWSFSFSISSSNEYLGLISFRIDCFDLLAVQRTLKSLL